MAAVRLTTSPGVRAAAASPLASQLWSSATATATATAVPASVPAATVAAAAAVAAKTTTTTAPASPPPPSVLARVRAKPREAPNRYFNPSNTVLSGSGGSPGKKPGDENKANLGKTLRVLQDHLPTVLQSPLPQEILAPNISLHLFPTTHPHLPTVSGRVAYTAALWTSPIAWNRLPLVGNVRLSIISERVTKQPLRFAPLHPGAIPEQLVVRWCASGKKNGPAGHASAAAASAEGGGARAAEGGDRAFTGLFVFQFDAEGRILSHTIETVQEGGDWEKGVGAKVVGLTDWLLGGMRRQGESPSPAFEGLGKKE
ncbi:DNA-directed RNA polymerase iii 130 kda polypeptide [Colletotrichum tofieldiae]|uniref:DNA-directed RNA polymerase iii 130 kDa polypeptide n=1 Tax=Colletotrichum tofieldiae TaxID=708197 RepID=A0A161WFZ9_9PEZI|nr:DNA-directed RNA polymerase iii 130 kda polypeptide [Colletotrichum tofieldiae]